MNDDLAPAGGSKRRYLTVLFSDLTGSTRLADSMEAEHYAELLTALREVSHDVVAKHGGTLVRMQGDGLLAIFGHPVSLEDDGRRAVEAALELHALVRSTPLDAPLPPDLPLALHSGVHAGLLLIEPGDLVRGRFEIVGDAANVAARLSSAAEPDEVLVSEETLGRASHFFRTGPHRRLAVKGKNQPIEVVPVSARAEVASRSQASRRRGLTPFIARQAELAVLEAALDDAVQGRARHLVIVAPPGTGKTRLAEEFLQRAVARGCLVHRGDCESYLSAEPLQPLLQVLRELVGLRPGVAPAEALLACKAWTQALDATLAAHAAVLRPLLATAGEGAAGLQAQAALVELLLGLSLHRPLLLFIDDWQWSDDATRHAVTALRAAIDAGAGHRLLLLVASRPSESIAADSAGSPTLALAAFDDDAAAETIARLLPRVDPFVQDEIRNYAGGNPLFIEELCHSASHEPTDRRARRSHGGPAWLEALIQSRVERLAPEQAELVRTAAVIGNVVPSWLLRRLTGVAEDHPRLRALADEDFLFPGDTPGTLRFKHGIARDVIYAAVGLRQRQALHLAVAEVLAAREEADAPHEALAYHYGAAGRPVEAARHAELAGDRARLASALDRAKTHYRAALAALDTMPAAERDERRWLGIAQRFGLACVFDAARQDLALFRRAVQIAQAHDDAPSIAAAEYWLGYIHYALGEAPAAALHGERALDAALRADAHPLAVQVRATLGQVRMATGEYDAALALLDEAIAVKRRHRSGGKPAVGSAYSLATKATVLGDLGRFDEAEACFAEALHAAGHGSHEVEASTRGLQAAVLLWQGRWDEARAAAAHACRIAQRVRSLYSLAMSDAAGAYGAWMTERRPESLQTIRRAGSWLESREGRLFASLLHGWRADGLADAGDAAGLRQAVAEALRRARQHDRLGVPMALRAMARAASVAGDGATADRWLARALDAAHARQSAHEIAVTRWAQAAWGRDRSAAPRHLDAAEAAFERMRMPWHLAQARALRKTTEA
ncbi:MAG TPA: AAA family ATPase [Methylibium sp.]|uniref:ATP-binding protein n=1 Tax=Methylibium sp. TaxID=2067992 RepID=UPI002DB65FB3|nr:AAA family ATPase [Methylibium sp.]HEU4459026.1 AAA family ATPase [Methylibium sp.]